MDLEAIQRIAEKEFDAYEILYLKEIRNKIESRDCELAGLEIREEEGIALRAIKGKRMVFSYTFALDKEGIERLVRDMNEMFPYTDEDDAYGFVEKKKDEDYPEVSLYDSEGQEVSIEDKISDLIEMEKTIWKDKRIVATRHCELTESAIFVSLTNSNGLSLWTKKTLYTLSALAVAKDGKEVSWYDYTWSHRLKDIKFVEFGEAVREKAISFLSPKQLDTRIYNGILSPRVASDLLSVLSSSFLGENLYKEKTRLKGKTNMKCFSELISIHSTGLCGPSSFPFDGEGFPSVEKEVVSEGYFRGFLFDSYYAKKLNEVSTGNCVREGIMDTPRCGIRGIYIREGGKKVPELSEGEILVEDLIGVHTANPVTGEFSLGAVGFIKEKGRLLPFQGVVMSGNVFEIFEKVVAVGDDLKFYGNYASPSIFVHGLRISGV